MYNRRGDGYQQFETVGNAVSRDNNSLVYPASGSCFDLMQQKWEQVETTTFIPGLKNALTGPIDMNCVLPELVGQPKVYHVFNLRHLTTQFQLFTSNIIIPRSTSLNSASNEPMTDKSPKPKNKPKRSKSVDAEMPVVASSMEETPEAHRIFQMETPLQEYQRRSYASESR
jgi:hypothetical protein